MNNIIYHNFKKTTRPNKKPDLYKQVMKLIRDNYPVDNLEHLNVDNMFDIHEYELYVSHLVYTLIEDIESSRQHLLADMNRV
jgi:hypothetical protein